MRQTTMDDDLDDIPEGLPPGRRRRHREEWNPATFLRWVWIVCGMWTVSMFLICLGAILSINNAVIPLKLLVGIALGGFASVPAFIVAYSCEMTFKRR